MHQTDHDRQDASSYVWGLQRLLCTSAGHNQHHWGSKLTGEIGLSRQADRVLQSLR